jgi:glycosyltransferase involved in cell wall biosynthesis
MRVAQMRILLSAYACEPNQLPLLNHDVFVLTRTRYESAIAAELAREPLPNLHFLFCEPPPWLTLVWPRRWPIKLGRRAYTSLRTSFFHFIWQYQAYQTVRHLHQRDPFDVVHHVTFATIRRSVFIGRLGTCFIFGPVGGGETIPWQLRSQFRLLPRFYELSKDIANILAKCNPLVRLVFSQAQIIYVTTEQTMRLVPKRYKPKVRLRLQLGTEGSVFQHVDHRCDLVRSKVNFLYVGRFLHWKGMHLGLQAFAKVAPKFPSIQLTLVGRGPEEASWKHLAENLGIDTQLTWLPWQPHSETRHLYMQNDVFLFPSLRDSGGAVVLEAMEASLATICLDLGGPALSVNESCGIVVPAKTSSQGKVIEGLAEAMETLIASPAVLQRLQQGARARSQEFTWPSVARAIYGEIAIELHNRSARSQSSVSTTKG